MRLVVLGVGLAVGGPVGQCKNFCFHFEKGIHPLEVQHDLIKVLTEAHCCCVNILWEGRVKKGRVTH